MAIKRILAPGNGDELTEVTPYGALLVYKWDQRSNQYICHSGDWDGIDGINARRGVKTNIPSIDEVKAELEQIAATRKQNAASAKYDGVDGQADGEPFMHSYPGNGWGL